MTWHVNFLCSKDTQKQLARTSLNAHTLPKIQPKRLYKGQTTLSGYRYTLLTVQNESTAQVLSFNAPHTRVSTKFLTGRTILCSIIIKVLCEITAH